MPILLDLLALAPQAIEAGKTLFQFLHEVRQQMQRTEEWNDEAEAAFELCIQAAAKSAEWQVRKPSA